MTRGTSYTGLGTPFVDGRVAAVWAAVHNGARSVRSVAETCGCGVAIAHHRLREARRLGLVAFTDGAKGTLRTNVGSVR